MAYTVDDVIKIPRDTWVRVADADVQFQVYCRAMFDLWAVESITEPVFEPAFDTPARLINNKENNLESYVDWKYSAEGDGSALWIYSKGSATHILLDI